MIHAQSTKIDVISFAMGPFQRMSKDHKENCVKFCELGALDVIIRILSDRTIERDDMCRCFAKQALQEIREQLENEDQYKQTLDNVLERLRNIPNL